MRTRFARAVFGVVAANGAALLLILLARWLSEVFQGTGGIFVTSIFVLIPTLMGIISAFFWQDLDAGEVVGLSALNLIVAYLISYCFLGEGVICLVMALPLIIAFLCLGTVIGRRVFRKNSRHLEKSLNRYQVSIVPLLVMLLVADAVSPHSYANHETDTLVIRARPQRVWQYIVDYPAITARPDYWLFRLGLPAPVHSTADGHAVGAQRRCIFRGGVTFDERITELIPARKLTFDVISQPNYPEAIGHITLLKGQFVLRDNGDGTTTVIGTSWYRLNVYPAAYYDLWVQDVIRHVHRQVMQHIKALAES